MKYVNYITHRLRNSISTRTNTISWKEVAEQDILAFIESGYFPPNIIQPLFHEFMHYWCANSPVGRAIQLLWLKYLKEMMTSSFLKYGAVEGEVVVQAAQVAAVEVCLRPLAEGLASFAEFDYWPLPRLPREHSSILTSLAILISFFNNPDALRNDHQARRDFVAHYLRGIKVKETTFLRKADLFCYPIAANDVNESYLLGYALVKDIYATAYKRSQRVLDPEFFLKYLRSYIYEDWTLVKVLLETSELLPATILVSTVLEHITGRLERLCHAELWNDMLKYEQRILELLAVYPPPRLAWESLPGLGLSENDIAAGRESYSAFQRRLFSGKRGNIVDSLLALASFKHDLLNIFAIDVSVTVDDEGNVAIYADFNSGKPILYLAGASSVSPRSGRGKLQTYLSYQAGPLTIVQSLTLENELIAFWARGLRMDDDYMESVEEALEVEVASVGSVFEGLLTFDNLLLAEGVSREFLDDFIFNASEESAKVYKSLIRRFHGIGSELLDYFATNQRSANRGLRALFENGRLLDAYSLISVCNSWTHTIGEISSILAERGYQLHNTLQYVDAIHQRLGVALLDETSSESVITVRL